MHRKKDRPKGHWVTTDQGHHIFITAKGQVVASRPGYKPRAAPGAHQPESGRARTAELVAKARANRAKVTVPAKPARTAKPAKPAAVRREKPKPTRGEMKEARREGEKKEARLVMADGSAPPEHVKPSMVPPKWTGVKVSVDPRAEVLVTARDDKGRPKMVTSKSYDARSAAVKFGRTDEMVREHMTIDREIHAARKDPTRKEEADCAYLMHVQATRPGSNADTKADVKAYGATTLEARHVVQSSDGVRLKFVGKEGIDHDHLVRDPDLARMLVERKAAAGGDGERIFRTDDEKVRDFTKSLDGGGFTPKDFRTSAATRMARDAVDADPRPSKSMSEHKKRVRAVAKEVSGLLGNEPAQALESYIHPAVFAKWSPE